MESHVPSRKLNLNKISENISRPSSSEFADNYFNVVDLTKYLISGILTNKKTFFLVPVFFAILAAVHVQYFVDPVYKTNLRFLPIASSSNSRVSQVSSALTSFGFDIGSGGSSSLSSARMFPEIIKSRTLAKKLLGEMFFSSALNDTVLLSEIFGLKGSLNEEDSLRNINQLATLVSSSIQVLKPRGSEIQTLIVKSREPKLSVDIALRIIDFVNELQGKFQNNSTKEKQIFINSRTLELTKNLEKAEEKLKNFRESNRDISSSPSLMLELTRLSREVEVQTELYITLKSQLELVKIEESGSINSVEILDYPELPFLKSSPNKKFRVLLWFFISLFLTTLFILLKNRLTITYKKIKSEFFV